MLRRSGKTVASSLLIGALALLIPAIAGCEAGFDAPTLQYHPAGGGAYTEPAGTGLVISNVFVLGGPGGSAVPAGSSASVFLSVSNSGPNGDTLQSVTAQGYASSVQVTGGTVSIPVSSTINLMGPQPSIVLSNLTKPLTAGQAISITLVFAHAGQVTLNNVPVEPHEFYYSTYSQPASPAPATASPTATPKATRTSPGASGSPTP